MKSGISVCVCVCVRCFYSMSIKLSIWILQSLFVRVAPDITSFRLNCGRLNIFYAVSFCFARFGMGSLSHLAKWQKSNDKTFAREKNKRRRNNRSAFPQQRGSGKVKETHHTTTVTWNCNSIDINLIYLWFVETCTLYNAQAHSPIQRFSPKMLWWLPLHLVAFS